ncbi:hypothetical protein [Alishewanella sp. HL-SH06]|uniref:hypothetical protein n=1 Tax=Alishewanella sp. HL-SH06 TaxID=3461144 RepID=UPI0040420225
MAVSFGKANYAKTVQRLIERIYNHSPLKDSIYEQAVLWFAAKPEEDAQAAALEQQLYLFENNHSGAKGKAGTARNLKEAESQSQEFNNQIEEAKFQRYSELEAICYDVLQLCQSDTFVDTNQQTAKMLGTIQLMSPTKGRHVAKTNQKVRHLYKALLSLRLLDRLVMDGLIDHPYIMECYQASKELPYADNAIHHPYRDNIHVTVLMAAILQDIGRCHPSCQLLLKGPEGNFDEFRELEADERNTFLQDSYTEAFNYVQHALSKGRYRGRARDERDRFVRDEEQKRELLLLLLKQAARPQEGIGNVLRIPQIYTSMVLSTKQSYNYEDLPKAALALDKSAELGKISKNSVAGFLRIVGMFPQGYGLPYIPKDSDGNDMDRYEYAIVAGLYPSNFRQPFCRIVTYSLTYQASARACVLSIENNLYFAPARKKLEVIPEERLLDILRKLVYDFQERMASPLIPKFWHPYDYFLHTKNQNLWNKAIVISN